jgi:hypothetical protein
MHTHNIAFVGVKVKRSAVTAFLSKKLDSRSYSNAWLLVDWLNYPDPRLKRHQKQTARAIEILREINRILATKGTPNFKWPPEVSRLSRELEPMLRHQRSAWAALVRDGRYVLEEVPLQKSKYGLLLVALLSQRGLEWVRQCPCGRWFIAYSSRNRFHSGDCKLAFEAASRKTPEGRRARAQWMREHRALLKANPKLKRKGK